MDGSHGLAGCCCVCAELPESDDELEGSDLDVALPAFMGESRAQLIRSREFAHGQLTAEVCAGMLDVHTMFAL